MSVRQVNNRLSINYFKEYPHLKQLLPNIEAIRKSSPELNYMLTDNQDCGDLQKIIKGSTVVLKNLSQVNQ
jgi:hypothetical protein